jgi:hypothetical protein
MTKICHSLVASTANEIAASAWEILSSDDTFHKAWPKPGPFVRRHWKDFIGHARAALAVMLATPMEPELERVMKEPIYEAFCIEGGYKAQPSAYESALPSATELARYGGLN